MSASTIVGDLAVQLGVSDAQLQAGLAQAVTQAQQAGQKMASAMNQAASGGGQTGKGAFGGFALNFSRMIDDAQYGFRGIVNNMEQIGTMGAQAFGASTANAMAFGAALTLTAVAINNLIPQLEKLVDTRSEWDKLTSGPIAFAGSVTFASDAMKRLQDETKKLMETDATSGAKAFISRKAKGLADWNDENVAVGSGPTLFSRFLRGFNPQTLDQQIEANRDAGKRIARNRVEIGIEGETARMNQDAFNRGLQIIGRDRAGGERETGKEYAKAFEEAATGRSEEIRAALFQKNVAAGMNEVNAEQEAIKDMGDAANGVKDAFDKLAKELPQLNLGSKLEQIYEAEAAPNRKAFIDQQNKERERLKEQEASIRERLASLQSQRNRSEIVGAADVFAKNLNAAIEDPTVKAIEKQTEELKQVMSRLNELQ